LKSRSYPEKKRTDHANAVRPYRPAPGTGHHSPLDYDRRHPPTRM